MVGVTSDSGRTARVPTTVQEQPWTELSFDQFGLHARLAVKTQQALYYKAGGSRLLTIVLTRDLEGKRSDALFYCTRLDWDARQVLSTYAYRWAIECSFENCNNFWAWKIPPIASRWPWPAPPPWRC
jgi:hypothetical protein